jgi:hypothetical protein
LDFTSEETGRREPKIEVPKGFINAFKLPVVVSTFASGSSAGGYRTGGVPPGR